jgi:YgiT-type zinc finger domain-containing protein
MKVEIHTCPMCGSAKIKVVRRTLRREAHGRSYAVPGVRFFECPSCGEKLYPPESIDKIQAHSPAFERRRRQPSA